MRTLATRIRRVEEKLANVVTPPTFVWLEEGDPVPDDGDGVMYVSWSDEGPEFPLHREPAGDVGREIEAILSELRAELTDEQIEAALGADRGAKKLPPLAVLPHLNLTQSDNVARGKWIKANVPEGGAKGIGPIVTKISHNLKEAGIGHNESPKQDDTAPQPNKADDVVRLLRRR